MNEIIIGKHTLESLTTGMYSDAKVIYREYIQNSVDSIESAIKAGIIKRKDSAIKIKISKERSKIIIKDNGLGISRNEVINKLLDIGNSKKNPDKMNGFRGIGRLAGLGYCEKLTFITSFKRENEKTEIIFDSDKLSEFLIPGKYEDYDLKRVIDEITSYNKYEEDQDSHFFKVILEGVKDYDDILNYDKIKLYLSQVAPVPYDKNIFSYSDLIKNEFKKKGINIKDYNISISNTSGEYKQIYKLLSDNFKSNRSKKMYDSIDKIEFNFIEIDNQVIAGLWYSISSFYGTINDYNKKGIRLRKGNFQIGDIYTLKDIFKEDRFNGWFQGELLTNHENLIPNARRDDFEKNETYKILKSRLNEHGYKLSKNIREISKKRNKIKKDNKIFKKIDILLDKDNNDLDYKILELNERIPNKDKKVLNKIFNIIDNEFTGKEKDKLINKIICNY